MDMDEDRRDRLCWTTLEDQTELNTVCESLGF